MFMKLFKYEWKANVKLFTILSGCALSLGGICGILIRLISYFSDSEELSLLILPLGMFVFFCILAIALYGTAVYYVQLFRFYKSRFTDQGYLTFTLPVKTESILLSSALNLLIWSAISVIVIIASFGIMYIIAAFGSLEEHLQVWKYVLGELLTGFTAGNILTLIFYGLCAVAYGIIEPLFAIILGSTIAKKYKIPAIIGIMYGLSMVYGMLNSTITVIMAILSVISFDVGLDYSEMLTILQYVLSGFLMLVLSAVAYFLSIRLMKNKLNLP